MLFSEMLHTRRCVWYFIVRIDTIAGHIRYHYVSNSGVSIRSTPVFVLAGWPAQLLVLVFAINVSCKHKFLFPSSSSQGQVICVDQASAKRPKTQNKRQKQQGGCARNMLSQHGRLWDLHAIHLSNCIRANSDCCGIGTANFPEKQSFPTEVSVAVSRRVVRVLRADDCCSTQQQQQNNNNRNSKKNILPPKTPDGRSHVPHVPHPVLCAALAAGRVCRSVCSLTAHMCGERGIHLWASERVSNKKQHKEAFDIKPLRVSLFFITGTKTRTRLDSHALVSSLGETRWWMLSSSDSLTEEEQRHDIESKVMPGWKENKRPPEGGVVIPQSVKSRLWSGIKNTRTEQTNARQLGLKTKVSYERFHCFKHSL